MGSNWENGHTMSYLTIKQVSQITGLPTHTLRFWEKEFEGILDPLRTKGGQRRYKGEDISIIENIKRLKKDGTSLVGIKEILTNENNQYSSDTIQIDLLAQRIAEFIKNEVAQFITKESL